MWYRRAQVDSAGNSIFNSGPFVQTPSTNYAIGNQPAIKGNDRQWSTITWSPQTGLQFWSANGKLIGTQQRGYNIFNTLKTFEPWRMKSDVTDKLVLDVYRQGKAAEQQIAQQGPNLSPQIYSQILSQHMANYQVKPQFSEDGRLMNPPEYYPTANAQTDTATRDNLTKEDMASTKKVGDQGFQFTPSSTATETHTQYAERYTQAYNQAYAEYQGSPQKMPFPEWKKQFDAAFAAGHYGLPGQPVKVPSNQVTTQNQSVGTYKMQQDASGNVSIVQTDGRVYAYIPAHEVQYQLQYIQRMTGQTPKTAPAAAAATSAVAQGAASAAATAVK